MSLVTQPNLATRRTSVRMGWVWYVDEHVGGNYTAAACPIFATIEETKRSQLTPRRAPNA